MGRTPSWRLKAVEKETRKASSSTLRVDHRSMMFGLGGGEWHEMGEQTIYCSECSLSFVVRVVCTSR